ncbi:MAG: hypothetical protein M1820_008534 [Bogoriella megaspora]|nr:MAG: hypothetical protein M1820_008534 [Bogoriella megaspora]
MGASKDASPPYHDASKGPASPSRAEEPSASTHQTVRGACHRCGAVVGEFFNSFIQVTGSYYLPALVGSFSTNGVVAKGRAKSAATGSELDGCVRSVILFTALLWHASKPGGRGATSAAD